LDGLPTPKNDVQCTLIPPAPAVLARRNNCAPWQSPKAKLLAGRDFSTAKWCGPCAGRPEVILSRAKAIPTVQKNSPAFVLNGLRTAIRLLYTLPDEVARNGVLQRI